MTNGKEHTMEQIQIGSAIPVRKADIRQQQGHRLQAETRGCLDPAILGALEKGLTLQKGCV